MSDQKSLFSTIFEEAGLGMLLVDQSGHVLRTNRTLQEWLGYSADELRSMTFDQFTFPEDIANDYVLFKELAQGKRTRYQVETRCIRKNGDVVWGCVTVSLVHPLEGDPVLVFRIIEDIEQRKQIEQAFQAKEARNRAIFEQVDIGIMVVDIEGKLLESNPALQALLEYTGDEISQFTIDDFTHPDDLTADREQFEDLVHKRRDHYQIEQRLRRKDGAFIWVKTTVSIVQVNREHPQFAVRVVENITLRKQIEEAFRKAYRAYRMLSQGNRILVRADNQIQLLKDVCRVIVESGEYVMAWVGFAEQDKSQSVYPAAYAGHESGYLSGAAITWADTERGRGPTGTAIRTGQTCIAQHIATNPAFEPWRAEALQRGYASSIALPLLAGKKTFGVLNIYAPEPDAFIPDEIVLLEELANDLAFGIMALHTRELHNQAERDFQASEIRYKHIVETALDAIISADSTGHIMSWNPAAETVFGYLAEEVVGKSVTLIMPERFQQAYQAGRQQFLSTRQILPIGNTVEAAGLRKDGSEFPLELTLAYWEASEETFFTFIVRDITERKRVEKALANERNLLRTLIDNLSDHIYVKDLQGRFMIRNEAGARHMGAASTDEVIGKTDFDYYSSELAERYHADDMTVIQSSQPLINQEEPTTATDGTQGWVLTSKVPLRDEEGNVIGLVGIGRDITERKRAEEQLRESEESFRLLFESNPHPMWVYDLETLMFLEVNDAAVEHYGYSRDKFLSMRLTDIRPPEDIARLLDDIQHERPALQHSGEWRHRLKNGQIIDVEIVSHTLEFAGHKAALVVAQDITERRRAEEMLRLQSAALRSAANAIVITDPNGVIAWVNPAFTALTGYTPDESQGRNPRDLVHSGMHDQAFYKQMWDTIQAGHVWHGEMINRRKDVSLYNEEQTITPVLDKNGTITHFVAIKQDVTARKQAEEELRKLAHAVEYSPTIVYITDANGRLEYVNPKFTEITGYTAEESLGRLPRILDPAKISREEYEERWRMISSGKEWRGEFQNRKKNGEPFWESVSISSIKNETGDISHLVLVIEDITERKRADQQLRELNETLEQRVNERTEQLNHTTERIETILNSSSDIIILCRPDGFINQVNPAFDRTFRYEPNQVHNQSLTQLVLPEHVAELERVFATVVENRRPQRLETVACSKDGKSFEVDMAFSPIVQHTGQVLGVVCSLRDITQRKQMEAQLRQMLEHEMELSELKSRYLSMAAHDLRNPLAVIQIAVNLIQQYGDRLTDEKLEEKYDRIQTNINVMVDMLDDILTLGKVESGKLAFNPAPVDVVTFCHNIATEMRQMAGTATPVVFSSQGDCSPVLMDAKLLRHILSNLLSNAIKYSPHNRPVTFTLHCEPDQITFRVQDQGIGIPEADQKQLFETFHRASNARQIPGTGLGLAIVKQSVELHGGTITFESEEGVGTTFTVTLPVFRREGDG